MTNNDQLFCLVIRTVLSSFFIINKKFLSHNFKLRDTVYYMYYHYVNLYYIQIDTQGYTRSIHYVITSAYFWCGIDTLH